MNLIKFLLALLGATTCLAASQHEYVCLNDGISLETQKGKVKLQVISDDIVRVITSPINTFSDRKSLVIQKSVNTPEFDIIEDENVLQVKTSQLIVSVERENGKVVFKDIYGKILLEERENGTKITPDIVCDEKTWNIRQQWVSTDDEVIHGLGHHQNNLYNLKGSDIDLWQENWEIVVPFFLSNRGYGVLWDNYSHSRFGFPVTQDFIPSDLLYDKDGVQGALTGSYYNGTNFEELCKIRRDSVINFDFKTFGPILLQ